jgi:HD-GYP domain-containing protein (c-di-GMP phosphodiesterase class II)
MATPELSSIAELILCHHEHWNGKGYPQGFKGHSIPKLSRILSIIDAYDVMTTGRIYKEKVGTRVAVAELKKGAGIQFDPELVDIFIELISK